MTIPSYSPAVIRVRKSPRRARARQLSLVLLTAWVAVAVMLPARLSAQTFSDVPVTHWAYDYIETLAASGITGGCGNGKYCPDDSVSRAQMAVFLERGIRGSDFKPPPATGNVFLDVNSDSFGAAYIEQLYLDGITGGCGSNNYCPEMNVTRAQMAVFLLRSKYGPAYIPPLSDTPPFADVDLSHWATGWIQQLTSEQITGGCGGGAFCPEQSVTRAQMAVFLVRTFGLQGPVNLSYVFDTDATASTIVDSGGGSVSAASSAGINITLEIPEGAVLDNTTFEVVPVESIVGLPEGFQPIVAAKLGPADTPFIVAPRLIFDMPAGFRGDKIAVGFFTNSDGTEFYLSPLIAPDGRFADHTVDRISLSKSSFSVGGAGLIDDLTQQDQPRTVTAAEKRAKDKIARILNEVAARAVLGGSMTEEELFQIETALIDWQADIERRLALVLSRIDSGDYSDADLLEGIALAGEYSELRATAQLVDLEEEFSGDDVLDRIAGVFVNAIAATYDLCDTTDEDELGRIEETRAQLVQDLQLLGFSGTVSGTDPGLVLDLDQISEDYLRCRLDIDLIPSFTRLETHSEAAVVTLVGRIFNPVSGESSTSSQAMTFERLGAYGVGATSNVTLGIISGDTLRFTVAGENIGRVTISGGRVLEPATAAAQVITRFSGDYTLAYQGSASGCDDPEDEGSESGSFPMTVKSKIVSRFGDTTSYELTGAHGGFSFTLTLTETAGNKTAAVSGKAEYTESETELVDIDGHLVVCTYVTMASGSLDGVASFSSSSVVMPLIGSNGVTIWLGTPEKCGSGTCRDVEGSITLSRSGSP
jgi:hypothetical protein